jgi:O-antigen/teichoic acid export membrane protein
MLINKKTTTSLLYIVFEGLSRGGNTLIFLLAASLLPKTDYVNLLALFSVEGLFINLSPIYYSEVLYKLRDKYDHNVVNQNILISTFIYFLILVVVVFILQNFLQSFYHTSLWIILLIVFNTTARLIFQNRSVNNQVDENHRNAIKDKAIPFFVSFVFGLLGFIILNDKILGFFAGRAAGYFVTIFVYFSFSKNKIDSKIQLNTSFLKDYFSRSSLLVLKGLAGWGLGYGMLNFLKAYYPEDVNYNVGLMLNVWSAFLLLANGINAVYIPAYRKAFNKGKKFAKMTYNTTLMTYFTILIISLSMYLILKIDIFQNLINQFSLSNYYNVVPYVLLIFLAQIFQYISMPVFYVHDKFRAIAYFSIIAGFIGIFVIITPQLLFTEINAPIIFIVVLSYL